jgi:hypothetical protein
MERKRRSETSSRSTPRKTFRGRLRVGYRTMEMGFMAWALPLDSRSGIRREPAKGTDKESQSSFHYPCTGR